MTNAATAITAGEFCALCGLMGTPIAVVYHLLSERGSRQPEIDADRLLNSIEFFMTRSAGTVARQASVKAWSRTPLEHKRIDSQIIEEIVGRMNLSGGLTRILCPRPPL